MNDQSDTNWLQEKNTIERIAKIEVEKVRTELRTELLGARSEISSLRRETDRLRDKSEELWNETRSLQTENRELRYETKCVKDENEWLKGKTERLQDELRTTRDDLRTESQKIDNKVWENKRKSDFTEIVVYALATILITLITFFLF